MNIVPIDSDEFDVEEYWLFNALSIEWLFILKKLGESVKAKPEVQHAVQAAAFDNSPIYMLKKSCYPAEVIAKAIGVEVEKLKAHQGIITLKHLNPQTDLPRPTVEYWGEA